MGPLGGRVLRVGPAFGDWDCVDASHCRQGSDGYGISMGESGIAISGCQRSPKGDPECPPGTPFPVLPWSG